MTNLKEKFFNPPHRLGKRRLAVLVLGIALLLSSVFVVTRLSDRQNPSRLNTPRLEELIGGGNCDNFLSEMESASPSQEDVKGSIKLLNFRASCYRDKEKYKEALGDYEQLLHYYEQQKQAASEAGEEHEVLELNDSIKDTKTSIKTMKLYLVKPPNFDRTYQKNIEDMTPEFKKKLESDERATQ